MKAGKRGDLIEDYLIYIIILIIVLILTVIGFWNWNDSANSYAEAFKNWMRFGK